MARPIKEGLEYFSHDTDAACDEKIEAIMSVHGTAGYAFYFIMLERMYKSKPPEVDLAKPAIKAMLARKMCLTLEQFDSVLKTALELSLFDCEVYEERQVLTSTGVKKRHEAVEAMRKKWRTKKRHKSDEEIITEQDNQGVFSVENTEDGTSFSNEKTSQETPDKSTQSKVKQSKEKESKEYEEEDAREVQAALASVIYPGCSELRTGFEMMTANQWAADNPKEVVLEAIRRIGLAGNGIKYPMRVIERQLLEWQGKQIRSVEEVRRDDESRGQRHLSGLRGGKNKASPGAAAPVDWASEADTL